MLQKLSRTLLFPLTAVVLALLVGAAVLLVSGANPLVAYAALLRGSLASGSAIGRTLEKATPLIFSGLAVAFAFRASLFNIGAQGQLLFGAVASAAVGFGFSGLPALIHVPLALLAGAIAGGLYGLIPGALKAYTGAHEVITTIMFNFIAFSITDYLADGPLKDQSAGNIIARTPQIADSAEIGTLSIIPIGFLIAVAVAAGTWWFLWRTVLGFEIRTVGLNASAAKYAGIRVRATIVLTMFLSGLLAGIGGAIETQGVVGRFQPGFNANLGFDGITIALLARTNPLGIIPAAILIGIMKAGASQMQFRAGVSAEITDIIQALILFFVAADMLVRKVVRRDSVDDEPTITLSTGWGRQS